MQRLYKMMRPNRYGDCYTAVCSAMRYIVDPPKSSMQKKRSILWLPPFEAGDFHFQKKYQNKSKIFADQNRFFASFNSLYSKIFLTPTLCLFYGCKKAESLADS
ncbi:MAG: hypothetical protein RIB93_24295 [Coleofasciculus sp. D1-CHI-01]|uniref:hypothetical protein n=1 Tax=Coleofasciculus sp. D1-CHI-01 TaxID=3068482 RepID=UPI0033010864